jgi:hypothetical protein
MSSCIQAAIGLLCMFSDCLLVAMCFPESWSWVYSLGRELIFVVLTSTYLRSHL